MKIVYLTNNSVILPVDSPYGVIGDKFSICDTYENVVPGTDKEIDMHEVETIDSDNHAVYFAFTHRCDPDIICISPYTKEIGSIIKDYEKEKLNNEE